MTTATVVTEKKLGRPFSSRMLNRCSGLINHLDAKYAGAVFTSLDLKKSYGVAFRGKDSGIDTSDPTRINIALNRMFKLLGLVEIGRIPTGKRGAHAQQFIWNDAAKQVAIESLTKMGGTFKPKKAKVTETAPVSDAGQPIAA